MTVTNDTWGRYCEDTLKHFLWKRLSNRTIGGRNGRIGEHLLVLPGVQMVLKSSIGFYQDYCERLNLAIAVLIYNLNDKVPTLRGVKSKNRKFSWENFFYSRVLKIALVKGGSECDFRTIFASFHFPWKKSFSENLLMGEGGYVWQT